MTEFDIAKASQGDTLDLICQRHYGRTQGTTEAVLQANPGLAAQGALLPMGTEVKLPRLNLQPVRRSVVLWD